MITGTLVNTLTVIVGSIIGLIAGSKISQRYKDRAVQAIGLCSLLIGFKIALKMEDPLVLLGSMILGGCLGLAWKAEDRLEGLGGILGKALKAKDSAFATGWITATLLFCVGSMAILGAIEEGLNGDPTILYTKAVLDGVSSIILASTFGVGVLFAAVPVLVYQGAITFAASGARDIFTETAIQNLSAVGGILIFAIGINLLGIMKLKIGDYLPALVIAVLLSFFS